MRQLSVQQKLAILEDNLKNENDLQNEHHVKYNKVFCDVLVRQRSDNWTREAILQIYSKYPKIYGLTLLFGTTIFMLWLEKITHMIACKDIRQIIKVKDLKALSNLQIYWTKIV